MRACKGNRRKMCLALGDDTITKLHELMDSQHYSLPGDVVEKAIEDMHAAVLGRKQAATGLRIRRET